MPLAHFTLLYAVILIKHKELTDTHYFYFCEYNNFLIIIFC